MQPIVDRRDATDDFATALGEVVLRRGMGKEGILGAVEELLDLGAKRRDPVRVPPVQPIGQIDEGGEVLGGLDAPDDRRAAQMTPNSRPMRPKASSAVSIWAGVWVAITLVRSRHCDGGTAGGTTGLVKTPAS